MRPNRLLICLISFSFRAVIGEVDTDMDGKVNHIIVDRTEIIVTEQINLAEVKANPINPVQY